MVKKLLLTLLVVILGSSILHGQGTIKGTVKDQTGVGLSYIYVYLKKDGNDVNYAMTDGDAYAASKSKKYYLPTEINFVTFDEDNSSGGLSNITYDKYGNMTSANIGEMIPVKYTIKYKDKKGTLSSVSFGYGDSLSTKSYNKKGLLTKSTFEGSVFNYYKGKKGTIKKVTINGETEYKVKSIKFHKNGFVSKVVYANGNVNKYNSNGLLTSIKIKNGPKYTYKYTKKKGKVVKAVVKRNGKKYEQITFKYGSAKTKDVWKYSCVICYAGGPSNACELYAKSSLSGSNEAPWD